jgi:hypothetical protein
LSAKTLECYDDFGFPPFSHLVCKIWLKMLQVKQLIEPK